MIRRLGRAAIGALAGCGQTMPEPAMPLTPPTEWCAGSEVAACRTTAEIEGWLTHPELAIVGVDAPGDGIQGAKILTLAAPGRLIFRAKWRSYATRSNLNDPRREIAAYGLQRLFLEPYDYVVPPTHGHCFALLEYRALVDPRAAPTFPGIDCVFGTLSYWIEDAETPADLYDPELYRDDPVYRRSVSNLNLLTFLIRHGDSHPRQFLMVSRRDGARVYSVDNSLCFEDFVNTNIGPALDFSRLQVPALPRDRVRELAFEGQAELLEHAVLEQYEERDGRLVAAPALSPAPPRREGLFWSQRRLSVALTEREIDGIEARLAELGRRLDRGDVALF